jgi:TusA-related sulfurtransferase
MHVNLQDLGFDEGGALLVKRALRMAPEGDAIIVGGTASDLAVHLRAWCRSEGHEFRWSDQDGGYAVISRGPAEAQRWSGAERSGSSNPLEAGAVIDHPPQRSGLAPRGSLVESGAPEFRFASADKVFLADGFEHQGRCYGLLSAIATEITGTRWNGLAFFGLAARRRAAKRKFHV